MRRWHTNLQPPSYRHLYDHPSSIITPSLTFTHECLPPTSTLSFCLTFDKSPSLPSYPLPSTNQHISAFLPTARPCPSSTMACKLSWSYRVLSSILPIEGKILHKSYHSVSNQTAPPSSLPNPNPTPIPLFPGPHRVLLPTLKSPVGPARRSFSHRLAAGKTSPAADGQK